MVSDVSCSPGILPGSEVETILGVLERGAPDRISELDEKEQDEFHAEAFRLKEPQQKLSVQTPGRQQP